MISRQSEFGDDEKESMKMMAIMTKTAMMTMWMTRMKMTMMMMTMIR